VGGTRRSRGLHGQRLDHRAVRPGRLRGRHQYGHWVDHLRRVREFRGSRAADPRGRHIARRAYFPDSLRGRTFTWNTGSHAYALATQDTSPARGVRFILYDADSTGRPLEPTNQLGTATFQDGPIDTTALHVFADAGVSQPTIAYLLSGSFHGDSFQAIVDGCMYDAARNLCITAGMQQHVVSGDTVVTVSGTASGTDVGFTFEIVFHFSAAGLADTLDVSALAPALQSQQIPHGGHHAIRDDDQGGSVAHRERRALRHRARHRHA